jgi:hypothetical protein
MTVLSVECELVQADMHLVEVPAPVAEPSHTADPLPANVGYKQPPNLLHQRRTIS